MIYAIYVLCALTVAGAIITASLYYARRNNAATYVKMASAALFCIAGIMAVTVRSRGTSVCALLLAGFLPAFAGDYFLAKKEVALTESSDYRYFGAGVISFAIAQVLYMSAFIIDSNNRVSPYFIPLMFIPLAGTLISLLTKFVVISRRRLIFAIPYGLLLGLSLLTAVSRYYLYPSASSVTAMAGAIAFCLSDMALAAYYFAKLNDKRFLNFPIMLLYFGAQVMYVLTMVL